MAESSTPTGAYAFRKRTRAAIKEDDDSAGSEDDSSGASLSEHDPTVEGGAVSDESIDEEARTTRGRAGKAAVKRRVVVKETPKKEPARRQPKKDVPPTAQRPTLQGTSGAVSRTPLLSHLYLRIGDLLATFRIEATRNEAFQSLSQSAIEKIVVRLPTTLHRTALCLTMNRYSAFCASRAIDSPAFPITNTKVALFLIRAAPLSCTVAKSYRLQFPQPLSYPIPEAGNIEGMGMGPAEGPNVSRELVVSWADALAYAQVGTAEIWRAGNPGLLGAEGLMGDPLVLELLGCFDPQAVIDERRQRKEEGKDVLVEDVQGEARMVATAVENRIEEVEPSVTGETPSKKIRWTKGGRAVDAPHHNTSQSPSVHGSPVPSMAAPSPPAPGPSAPTPIRAQSYNSNHWGIAPLSLTLPSLVSSVSVPHMSPRHTPQLPPMAPPQLPSMDHPFAHDLHPLQSYDQYAMHERHYPSTYPPVRSRPASRLAIPIQQPSPIHTPAPIIYGSPKADDIVAPTSDTAGTVESAGKTRQVSTKVALSDIVQGGLTLGDRVGEDQTEVKKETVVEEVPEEGRKSYTPTASTDEGPHLTLSSLHRASGSDVPLFRPSDSPLTFERPSTSTGPWSSVGKVPVNNFLQQQPYYQAPVQTFFHPQDQYYVSDYYAPPTPPSAYPHAWQQQQQQQQPLPSNSYYNSVTSLATPYRKAPYPYPSTQGSYYAPPLPGSYLAGHHVPYPSPAMHHPTPPPPQSNGGYVTPYIAHPHPHPHPHPQSNPNSNPQVGTNTREEGLGISLGEGREEEEWSEMGRGRWGHGSASGGYGGGK